MLLGIVFCTCLIVSNLLAAKIFMLGTLALFTLPFIVLGLVLRNPLIKLVGKFVEKVESTKVM